MAFALCDVAIAEYFCLMLRAHHLQQDDQVVPWQHSSQSSAGSKLRCCCIAAAHDTRLLAIKQQTDVGPESIIVGTDQRLSRNVYCVMQTHQDQLFFEAVYSALAAIIHEALGSFKTRQQIDVEVCTYWLAISALCLKLQHSFSNSMSERPTF